MSRGRRETASNILPENEERRKETLRSLEDMKEAPEGYEVNWTTMEKVRVIARFRPKTKIEHRFEKRNQDKKFTLQN